MSRITVAKTYKLFINGAFSRTESGRSMKFTDRSGNVIAHLCHGSRKDLRDAVESAKSAQPGWAGRSAYNRGQILYRLAEMLESRSSEFESLLTLPGDERADDAVPEVEASIDRLVCFAGWSDKFAQVLGCNNPVAGPHYNFTIPEPTGIVAVFAPQTPALLGLISLLAPPLCAGNTLVIVASKSNPLPAVVFGELCATSDVPPGVINILTTETGELDEHIASHRQINAITAANVDAARARVLQAGAAENVKRVHVIERSEPDAWYDATGCESPWTIEPFLEMKTIWHPSSA